MAVTTNFARTPGQRIDALDVLRGFAVCGMLLINIPMMGNSIWDVFSNPSDSWTTAQQSLYWVKELMFEGSSRAMFSILFGASFMLMMAKAMQPTDPLGPVDIYYRRCIWMMVFGVIHATLLLWPGDILFHYALPAMALFAFRRADPRLLLAVAAVAMVLLNLAEGGDDIKQAQIYQDARPAIAKQLAGQELTDAEETAIVQFEEARASKSKSSDNYSIELAARKHYFSSVAFQTATWLSWLDFDAFGWALEAFAFMLIGIALFKLGILTGERSTRFYLTLGIVGLAVGLAINGHETWLKWSTKDAPGVWLDEMTYQHGRLAICLGNIGLLVAAARTSIGQYLLQPLQYIGRMALSNYIGQSIIAAILFTGFGLFGKLSNPELWAVAVLIWIVQAIFSRYWLRYHLMGPMEWVWRSLTYWKMQPLTRTRTTVVGAPLKQ